MIYFMHRMKIVQIRSFFWSVFFVFGQNTEIYRVNLSIKPKYWKIRNRNNSVFGHFSCSHMIIESRFLWMLTIFNNTSKSYYRAHKAKIWLLYWQKSSIIDVWLSPEYASASRSSCWQMFYKKLQLFYRTRLHFDLCSFAKWHLFIFKLL